MRISIFDSYPLVSVSTRLTRYRTLLYLAYRPGRNAKGVKMPNGIYSLDKICKHCGRQYEAARVTSQFCSDRCRLQHHRQRDKAVQQPLMFAAEYIRQIGALTEGSLSYEAIVALKNLRKMVDFQDVSRKDSWWRCQKCWQSVQKELPQDGDCSCGKCEDARWQLQKRLL